MSKQFECSCGWSGRQLTTIKKRKSAPGGSIVEEEFACPDCEEPISSGKIKISDGDDK